MVPTTEILSSITLSLCESKTCSQILIWDESVGEINKRVDKINENI